MDFQSLIPRWTFKGMDRLKRLDQIFLDKQLNGDITVLCVTFVDLYWISGYVNDISLLLPQEHHLKKILFRPDTVVPRSHTL